MEFLKLLKWTFIALAVLLVWGAILFIVLLIAFNDIVSIEELKRVPSPDGTYSAILETRDAGATTATSYYVYLHYENGEPYEESERVFLAEHAHEIQLVWLESDVLSITNEKPVPRKDVWLQVMRKGSIEIRYNDSLLPPAAASP